MHMTRQYFARFEHFVDSIPDERLFTIAFLIRVAVFILMFLLSVAAIDTLVTIAPIKDVVSKTFVYGKTVAVDYSYKTRRSIDFTLHHTLSESSVGDKYLGSDSIESPVAAADTSEKQFRRVFNLESLPAGHWCLDTSVEWISGLSMVVHRSAVAKTCFDV